MKYFDASAKQNFNVQTFMNELIQEIAQSRIKLPDRSTIKLRKTTSGMSDLHSDASSETSGKKCCK